MLAPGADPSQIVLMFDGAERVEIDARGDLVLQTGATLASCASRGPSSTRRSTAPGAP